MTNQDQSCKDGIIPHEELVGMMSETRRSELVCAKSILLTSIL